ncbi:MAG: hypothetical protein E6G37_01595 [Actinobacteria bacterium]|nr:MAG: hypothetical protein E6G37_01595 [Actinomycetota bacterium]
MTTASPVLTAMWISRSGWGELAFSCSMMRGIAKAARTARSASSPRATGEPKTAMTASPMNFSTTPPNRSIVALTAR